MIGGEIAFQGRGAANRGEYRQAAGAIERLASGRSAQ